MKQIQNHFQKNQLEWIYIGYPAESASIEFPKHIIWINRSDRLGALRILGQLGYRLLSCNSRNEEYGVTLDHPEAEVSRIFLVWSLKWLSLESVERKLWEGQMVRTVQPWGISLRVLNPTDRWVVHLTSLMHQDEKTMDAWVDACSAFIGRTDVDWQRLLSMLTVQFPGPVLAKVIQIAAFWKISFPDFILDQARLIEKEGKLAKNLRRELDRKQQF